MPFMQNVSPRHDWSLQQAEALFAQPFADLIFDAQRVHRAWHVANTVQMSTLLSIKTGACPEDCAYCPQSVRYDTGVGVEALMPVAQVVERARGERDGADTPLFM
jgi:biotin synthase